MKKVIWVLGFRSSSLLFKESEPFTRYNQDSWERMREKKKWSTIGLAKIFKFQKINEWKVVLYFT